MMLIVLSLIDLMSTVQAQFSNAFLAFLNKTYIKRHVKNNHLLILGVIYFAHTADQQDMCWEEKREMGCEHQSFEKAPQLTATPWPYQQQKTLAK